MTRSTSLILALALVAASFSHADAHDGGRLHKLARRQQVVGSSSVPRPSATSLLQGIGAVPVASPSVVALVPAASSAAGVGAAFIGGAFTVPLSPAASTGAVGVGAIVVGMHAVSLVTATPASVYATADRNGPFQNLGMAVSVASDDCSDVPTPTAAPSASIDEDCEEGESSQDKASSEDDCTDDTPQATQTMPIVVRTHTVTVYIDPVETAPVTDAIDVLAMSTYQRRPRRRGIVHW